MASVRVQHYMARSSSLIRRGTNSSYALNANRQRRVVVPRPATGQGRDDVVSTNTPSASALPLLHDRKLTRAGGVANARCYADGAGFFDNLFLMDGDGDGRWMNRSRRAFSSTGDAVDVDDKAVTLNQKIISLAESGDIREAEELLEQMQADAISQNDQGGLPDVDSYTALMNAFIDEQRRLMSAIEVETNEIESDANATMPNERSVESNERGAVTIMALAEKAHDLLIRMEDISGVSDHYSSMRLSERGGEDGGIDPVRNESLKPDSHHYDSVISAFANAATAAHDARYANHLTKNAPFVSQRWLARMETLAFDPRSGVRPTVDSYFHVMEAYAKATDDNTAVPNKRSKVPVLVQMVFDKLIQNTNILPTEREYRLMMRTWCSNTGIKEAAWKATGLLMTMQKSFKEGVEDMEPTLEDGTMVLEAWTRSNNRHSARRAQTILSTMEYFYSSKKSNVRPDLDCYRYVLTTMSRSRVPDVGSSIPKLFKSMENNHIFPDTACFDAAIETLKNCSRHAKSEDAIKYANATESMLQRMEKERDRSSVGAVIKPSSITYTNVIQALAVGETKKAADKVDELLNKMIKEHAAGDESMQPNRDCYVGTIHAYGMSGSESNFVLANNVLQRMLVNYSEGNEAAQPDISSFHAVISACARASITSTSPKNHKEALLLAISTVQQMKKSPELGCPPNSRSYELLLKCGTSLLSSGPERERALRSFFRSCCKDGLANKKMLDAFRSAVSNDAYYKEVVRDAPSYSGIKALPKSWTRNLGYRPRSHEVTEGGMVASKRDPIISVSGERVPRTAYNDHRMRRRLEKKNQKLLQGGRI